MAKKSIADSRAETVTFDPNKPRAVCMKVRCSNASHNQMGYDLNNGEKCQTVYLRIVENEDNPTPMDLRTTHVKCPICGSEEYETLTNWKISKDGLRVIVTPVDPI